MNVVHDVFVISMFWCLYSCTNMYITLWRYITVLLYYNCMSDPSGVCMSCFQFKLNSTSI